MSDAGAILPGAPLPPAAWKLEPLSRWELVEFLRDGDLAATAEELLARVARAQGAVELAISEGLAALSVGERAMRLGWSSLKDYGRELLDVSDRTVCDLARLGRELKSRPLLRAALRSGAVCIRSAQVVLPVAIGRDEARWVALARDRTVRDLEQTVRRETDPEAGEDGWDELSMYFEPEQRELLDEALALAGRQLGPGSSRAQRLEALAQEYLGSHPVDELEGGVPPRVLGGGFRSLASRPSARLEAFKAQLERDTERWRYLPEVEPFPAVEDGLEEESAPQRIDARLKELASMRRDGDRVVGYLALIVKRTRLWSVLGFADFEHYCSERLGLGVRTVEQRAALEQRLWEVPPLRQAVEDGLPYEKARLVGRYRSPEEIETWIARAREKGMTVVALKRAMEAEDEAQMRARRRLVVRMPSRVSLLLAAAFEAVKEVEGKPCSTGECLAKLAEHFIAVWKRPGDDRKTRARKVLERDRGWCTCPGCTRRADDSHHVQFRSRGGGDELPNQTSLCRSHHLRGVHMGRVRVRGSAPDALVWELGERAVTTS